MTDGIRVRVHVSDPGVCQIAPASAGAEAVDVARTAARAGGEVVEEFTLRGDTEPDGMERVFGYGSAAVYRFSRDADQDCVCERIESAGYPVRSIRAEDGGLLVSFLVPDRDALRSVVADLADRFEGVAVRRLTRYSSSTPEDLVFVDRSRFTDRQIEVIETAHRMGYFEHPKGANAGEVADELDISTSTFVEHLATVQTKLMDALLAD